MINWWNAWWYCIHYSKLPPFKFAHNNCIKGNRNQRKHIYWNGSCGLCLQTLWHSSQHHSIYIYFEVLQNVSIPESIHANHSNNQALLFGPLNICGRICPCVFCLLLILLLCVEKRTGEFQRHSTNCWKYNGHEYRKVQLFSSERSRSNGGLDLFCIFK